MVALIIGVLLVAFCVFACLPAGMGLGWSADVINFLKGFAPFIAAFIGLVAVLIGIADMKDKREAKREEQLAAKAEKEAKSE